MDVFEGLQKLGLSKKEATAYLVLLELGEAPVGKIAQRTGIHRRSCYDALNSLQEKGLASYSIAEGAKTYKPTGLDAFNALVREQEALIEGLLPALQKKKRKEAEPTIEIFRGIKSTKSIFESLLKDRRTIYIYGSHSPARIYLKYYYPKWTKTREKLGIRVKAVHTDVPGVREFVKSLPFWEARFIDKKLLSPSFWWVQGERVFLVFWGEEPTIIRITNKNMVHTYLGAFRILWGAAKK